MIPEYEEYIAHYGIKGQKHGVRRFQNEDGSLTDAGKARYGVGNNKDWRRLNRDAKNDAKEYARARAYYGEGAGNRRKFIHQIVNERSKDPDYKAAFERELAAQNTEKAVDAAHRKRRFEDAKAKAGVAASMVIGIAAPLAIAHVVNNRQHYAGVAKHIARSAKTKIGQIYMHARNAGATRRVNNILNNMRRR